MNPIDYWYQKYLKEKLTAEDVQLICEIEDRLWDEETQEALDGKGGNNKHYEEVLKRFNEQRNETN